MKEVFEVWEVLDVFEVGGFVCVENIQPVERGSICL